MSSAFRRLAQEGSKLTRGLQTSAGPRGGVQKYSHEELVYGDGHHGLRKGYTYVRHQHMALSMPCFGRCQHHSTQERCGIAGGQSKRFY